MPDTSTAFLQQQMPYYQARASEYDEWFLRQGRYDHGAAQNARWFTEVTVSAMANYFLTDWQSRRNGGAHPCPTSVLKKSP
jgi:hypothetical protein